MPISKRFKIIRKPLFLYSFPFENDQKWEYDIGSRYTFNEKCQDWKPPWNGLRTRAKPRASFSTKIATHCDGCCFPHILSCFQLHTLSFAHAYSGSLTLTASTCDCFTVISMPYYSAYSSSSNSLLSCIRPQRLYT